MIDNIEYINNIEERLFFLEKMISSNSTLKKSIIKKRIQSLYKDPYTSITAQHTKNNTFYSLNLQTFLFLPQLEYFYFLKSNNDKFLKSLLLNKEGNILSVGLPFSMPIDKFFGLSDFNKEVNNFNYYEKIDGSCLIITQFEDGYIIRSRSSVYGITKNLSDLNLIQNDLGDKIISLFKQFPNKKISIIGEIQFPQNNQFKYSEEQFIKKLIKHAIDTHFIPIVKNDEENFYITNIIDHTNENNIFMLPQSEITLKCSQLQLNRPNKFVYRTFDAALEKLNNLIKTEGNCVYFNSDQTILKAKSTWYKTIRSNISELYEIFSEQKTKIIKF